MAKRIFLLLLSAVAFTASAAAQTAKSLLSCPDDNHPHSVNLGLPSGTRWACCNIGASLPTDFGRYFAWGETQAKETFSTDNYQYYANGSYQNLGADLSGTDYDAAHVDWGGNWTMPNNAQIQELYDNATWTETSLDGVEGYIVEGLREKRIFFPLAGYRTYESFYLGGQTGFYWSASQYAGGEPSMASRYMINKHSITGEMREIGLPIRAVDQREPDSLFIWQTGDNVAAYATLEVDSITYSDPRASFLTCPDDNHPHAIDLGLPSGVKWACCNVGATKPDDRGGYYAWGETEEHKYYTAKDYSGNDDVYTSWGSNIAGTEHDVARVKWGDDWQMPTIAQVAELFEKGGCTLLYTNHSHTADADTVGWEVTGSNGGRIFVPLGGSRWDTQLRDPYTGNYWTAEQLYAFWPRSTGITYGEFSVPYCGYNVRPIRSSVQNSGQKDALFVRLANGRTDYYDVQNIDSIAFTDERKRTFPVYTSCPDDLHPHIIDLGLPSGTKWECCNMGADKPESSGTYYAWAEMGPKNWYTRDNYAYFSSYTSFQDLGDIGKTKYDVVRMTRGYGWSIPAPWQFQELCNSDYCTWTETTQNGVSGYLIEGLNGGRIFLPAAGYRDDLNLRDYWNVYWSSQGNGTSISAYCLLWNSEYGIRPEGIHYRYYGVPIRPVYKK